MSGMFLQAEQTIYPVFISNNFVPRIENIILRKIPGTHSGKRISSHRYLKFALKIINNNRGPGNWKLNVSYCENEEYKRNIRDIIVGKR